MASAAELEGRRTPTFPGVKGDKTVTFVGPDGNTLEVLASIDKNALAILKRRGFKKQSQALREQEEAALAKIEGLESTSSQEDNTAGAETEGDGPREPSDDDDTRSPEAKKAASRRSR